MKRALKLKQDFLCSCSSFHRRAQSSLHAYRFGRNLYLLGCAPGMRQFHDAEIADHYRHLECQRNMHLPWNWVDSEERSRSIRYANRVYLFHKEMASQVHLVFVASKEAHPMDLPCHFGQDLRHVRVQCQSCFLS
ncbi:unannotated protein [freshwater metagenome]|uniref:Unannotated protein n=1 Tax=freshwater metagenome TaxID=449393 RepID=A0A6J7MPH3_9ZZZZ